MNVSGCIGEPIFSRAAESINRPLSVENCKKTLDFMAKALNTWPAIKPWLEDDLIELGKEVCNPCQSDKG